MILVVNCELGMKPGKIAAQCSHAAVGLVHSLHGHPSGDDFLESWFLRGQPKIAVRGRDAAHLKTLGDQAKALGLPRFVVADAGRTQVKAGSVTVLAIIGPKKTVDEVTGTLKLL